MRLVALLRHRFSVVVALGLTIAPFAIGSCKKPKPTCNPDEKNFEVFQLVLQPELMNMDGEGNPRATVLRVYQLQGGRTLDSMDFDSVFEDPAEFFGDELLAEKEFPVYPERPEVIEIEVVPDATHVVAVALFREPTGNTWYREWDVPQFHGHSVCRAEIAKQTWSDPCFYLTIEGTELDGGHEPSPAFDADKFPGLMCPGKPLKIKPPEDTGKKKKKRKKRDLKGDAEKTKDGADKAQGGADKAQGGADTAEKAGEAGGKVGGK